MRANTLSKIIFTAAALSLSACAHMQVPPELAQEALRIEEKPGFFSGNLRFGPFRALEISQGFSHGGTSTWFGTFTNTDETQDFGFRFEEDGQPAREVACRAAYHGSSTALSLGKLGTLRSAEGKQTLDCKFGPPGAGAPEGILRLDDAGSPGRMELGEAVLEVQANDAFANGAHSGKPLGYVLSLKSGPVAAVDSNYTAAWMKKDLPASLRSSAGIASAILLLYRPQESPR